MTGFALSALGAEDQMAGGFATVAAILGVIVAVRSKFDKPTARSQGADDPAQLEDRRSEVTAGDPYGRWWRQSRG